MDNETRRHAAHQGLREFLRSLENPMSAAWWPLQCQTRAVPSANKHNHNQAGP